MRKRHTDENNENIHKKASKLIGGTGSGISYVNTGVEKTPATAGEAVDASVEDPESLKDSSTALSTQSKTTNPEQKVKRGRKMTIMTKDSDDSMPVIIDNNSSVLSTSTTSNTVANTAANTAAALAAKKKKRGRKSNINPQRPNSSPMEEKGNVTTASTSDEDEECSALNCIRPSGT